MDGQIKNVSLKFACTADWNSMETVDGAKFCKQCQKKVYDFTDAKAQEFLKILAENGNSICGRFEPAQMAPKFMVLSPWKKWISAAMMVLGINLFSQRIEAQSTKPKSQTIAADLLENLPAVGSPESFGTSPDFPGGQVKFDLFLKTHLRKIKGTMGRLIVKFEIEPDGSLTDITVVRGINEQADREAIRVMKLSPKWIPSIENGKAVKVHYSLPINFY